MLRRYIDYLLLNDQCIQTTLRVIIRIGRTKIVGIALRNHTGSIIRSALHGAINGCNYNIRSANDLISASFFRLI